MVPRAIGAVLVMLLAGLAVTAGPSVAVGSDVGTVAAVNDGDTITLAGGRRVRLLQVDAPELGSGECYSRAARTALRRLVPIGSRVVLEADPVLDRVDRYRRLLRYVRRNGVNVNLQLVRVGAAAPYFYRGERGGQATALLRAAREARRAPRGLWRACPAAVLDPVRAISTG